MITQELLDYIKNQRQRGVTDNEIRNSLVEAGWKNEDIEEALRRSQVETMQLSNESESKTLSQNASSDNSMKKLPSVDAAIRQSTGLFKSKFRTTLLVVLVPALSSILPPLLLEIISRVEGPSIFIFSISFLVSVFFYFLMQAWGIISLVVLAASESSIGFVEAYKIGFKKIFSYWWIVLLSTFILIGAYILLIVPGIILSISFSLAIFVLVAENIKGMNALLKSREYARGHLGYILFHGIVLGFLVGWPFLLTETFGVSDNLFFVLLLGLYSLFALPFALNYTFLIYKNLKLFKGDFVFQPGSKDKAKYVAIGVLGIIVLIAGLWGVLYLFGSAFGSLDSAREQSRDVERAAYVRQTQTALEFYYEDSGFYPDSLSDLSLYISELPVAPEPADGQCSAADNQYQYNAVNEGQDYELTFCLGSSTGGFLAGLNEVNADTADGTSNLDFQSDVSDEAADFEQQFPGFDSFDFSKELEETQSKSRDAKRLADVRQTQTALEFYYEDSGFYPDSLSDLSLYISELPVAPEPADGNCTAAQNQYRYKALDYGNDYILEFCIGGSTGGLAPGERTAKSYIIE